MLNPVEPKGTMKENQNGILYHSNGYGRDVDMLASERKDKDEFWKTRDLKCSVAVDDFAYSDDKIRDSQLKENQSGILCQSNDCGRDEDSLACDTNNRDELWSTTKLESSVVDDLTNGNEKENNDSVAPCSIHLELFQKVTDLVSETNEREELWSTPELECTVVVDDFTNGNENEYSDSVAPCSIHSQSFDKDTDLYTDKNVMECDLPELIVCYRESTYQIVKDICIDEGVFCEDKILTENSEVDQKGLHTSLPCDENKQTAEVRESADIGLLVPNGLTSSSEKDCDDNSAKDSWTKEKRDTELFIPDELKSSSEDGIDMDAAKECGPGDSIQIGEADSNATDKFRDDASREEFFSSGMLPQLEFASQKSLKSLLESSDNDGNEVKQHSAQISCAEAVLDSPVMASAAEDLDKNDSADNLSYNSKVDSGIITLYFDSSKSAASGRDENPENVHEQPFESQILHNHDDGASDNLSIASQVQRGGGESSFSTAGPVSGLVTYSGSIAFSGSISLRSDSSTTSTRSFAFPILQPEWNSSPVRMAKADRRRFRKNTGWRQGLLCCRF
ncbi:unnamed protein product [Ilex paraguariensis]|uniref:18S pre-ribosomal assembly protein gar2-related n=1 Tax=Ilex paraguariensis TaxID=185542 RepID=A0ABC8UD39_9AQUA